MFHHFHDDKNHIKNPRYNTKKFEEIINFIGLENIITPDEFKKMY